VEKIQLNNTYAYSEFITEDEQSYLLDWINTNTNTSQNKRIILPLKDIPNVPLELIEKYKLKIVQLENLKNFLP
jgi:hypothetical protein